MIELAGGGGEMGQKAESRRMREGKMGGKKATKKKEKKEKKDFRAREKEEGKGFCLKGFTQVSMLIPEVFFILTVLLCSLWI